MGWSGRASTQPAIDRDAAGIMSGHVGYAPKSGSQIRALVSVMPGPWWVDDAARRVIQAPKPERRIMRYKLTDYEWMAIKRFLPNTNRASGALSATAGFN
jgi:hypothetical protein